MMRRCGSPSVKSLALGKYTNFIKSVLENHRGKTSSKKAVTTETEPNLADSAPSRWQKRTHKEEDSARPIKRMRVDKWKGGVDSSSEHRTSYVKKEVKQFGRDKSKKDQQRGHRMNRKRTFDSVPIGRKGTMQGARGGNKKIEKVANRPATPSLPKHKNVGKKWQNSTK